MKSGFARLKMLVEGEKPQWKQDGMLAGYKWACDSASPRQLRLLQNLMNDIKFWEVTSTVTTEQFIEFLEDNVDSYQGVDENLVVTISDDDIGSDEATEFWAPHIRDDPIDWPRPAFVLGFVEGALGFWKEFREDLQSTAVDNSGC